METSPNPDASKESLISSQGPFTLSENRLSMPFILRVTGATTCAFFTGMILGVALGSKEAALRFRAENAHRLPTTSTGWYLYHKSKNYHVMLGALKEGFKGGTKIGFWTGGIFVVEEAVDRLRGKKDFVSTCVAGLAITGGFSAWSEYPSEYFVSNLQKHWLTVWCQTDSLL